MKYLLTMADLTRTFPKGTLFFQDEISSYIKGVNYKVGIEIYIEDGDKTSVDGRFFVIVYSILKKQGWGLDPKIFEGWVDFKNKEEIKLELI